MTRHLRTRAKRTTTVAAAVGAIMLIAACSSGADGDTGQGGSSERQLPALQLASSLRRLDSCDDVRAWARDELAPRVGAYGLPGGFGGVAIAEDAAEGDVAVGVDQADSASGDEALTRSAAPAAADAEGADAPAGGQAPPSFSETNVQVEGVDEPDIVKTDGERIVTLANGRLYLASAGRGRIVDAIELPGGLYDGQLLLADDRVIVFGTADAGIAFPLAEEFQPPRQAPRRPEPAPYIPTTRVVQVDIDGDTLALSDSFELDGIYVSARMTGDVARLVLHAEPQARMPGRSSPPGGRSTAGARSPITARWSAATAPTSPTRSRASAWSPSSPSTCPTASRAGSPRPPGPACWREGRRCTPRPSTCTSPRPGGSTGRRCRRTRPAPRSRPTAPTSTASTSPIRPAPRTRCRATSTVRCSTSSPWTSTAATCASPPRPGLHGWRARASRRAMWSCWHPATALSRPSGGCRGWGGARRSTRCASSATSATW